MSHYPELISQVGSLHKMIVTVRDMTGFVGLKIQLSLLENDDDELRARWNSITLEISHLLKSTERSLNQISWAKDDKPAIVGKRRREPVSDHFGAPN